MGLCVAFNDNTVPNYSKENLSQLVEKRVGIETYISKLTDISRHEVYSRAAKQPQIKAKHSSELLLEFEFCKLFKSLESVIILALRVQRDISNGISELSLNEQENVLLLQYKELIRDQDRRIQDLQSDYQNVQMENQRFKQQIEELQRSSAQLQDQNTLLRAQLAAGAVNAALSVAAAPDVIAAPSVNQDLLEKLQVENKEKDEELERLRKDQEDLLVLLVDQEVKLNTFKNRLLELGQNVEDAGDSDVNSIGSDNETNEAWMLLKYAEDVTIFLAILLFHFDFDPWKIGRLRKYT